MKVKNIDSSIEKLDKLILGSLSFLDNQNVYISIVFILFLYNTCLFSNINNLVSEYYENPVVKVVMLLLVIYVYRKSCLIGLLLGLSYVISLNYKSIVENFVSGYDSTFKTEAPVNNKSNESFENHSETSDENEMNTETSDENEMNTEDNESFENTHNIENFDSEEPVPYENDLVQNSTINQTNNESFENKKNCSENYMPKFESVGNVCSPVSTFENTLDAQGLNSLNGYEKIVGSNLN